MDATNKPQPILFLSDARGIYIPRDFAKGIKRDYVAGIAPDTWKCLEAGPDHEWYWEAWAEVERDAIVTDPTTGIRYRVYQDGDCWLLPEGMTATDSGELTWEERANAVR